MQNLGHGFRVKGRVLEDSRRQGIRVIKKIKILGISAIPLCPEGSCPSCDLQRKYHKRCRANPPTTRSSA